MVWILRGEIRPIPFSIRAPRRMKETRGSMGVHKNDCTGCYHQQSGATNIFSSDFMELHLRFVLSPQQKYLCTILYAFLTGRSHSFGPKAHFRYLSYILYPLIRMLSISSSFHSISSHGPFQFLAYEYLSVL